MNVINIKESVWDKKDGNAPVRVTTVRFDDGREVPGYDLPFVPEIDKPLPDGWSVETAKSGKLYIKVPKAGKSGFGGGAAAFRNTKEGFLAEQDSIHRSVALKLTLKAIDSQSDAFWPTAEKFYSWLRKTSSGSIGQSIPPGQTTDEVRPVSAPRSNIPVQLDEIRVDNRVLNRAYPSAGPGEEPAEARAELVVEGSGDGFCPNYSDHSFVKLNGTMTCKKCGAVRM